MLSVTLENVGSAVRAMTLVAISVAVMTASTAAQPAPPPPTYPELAYSDEHFRHKLDLYIPDDACGPLPVVMFIPGGGWLSGEKEQAGQFAQALMDRGFAIAAINHRFSYQAIFPAQIHDCKAAVRWLRGNAQQYNLDSDHVAAFGESSGGHLAALLGTSFGVPELEGEVGEYRSFSSQVQAVADFYGPTDLFALGAIYNSPTSTISLLFDHPIQDIIDHIDDPEYADLVALVNSANPVLHVSSDDATFHIAHGDVDEAVPISQSQLLHDALLKAGVVSTFLIVPGAGHELPPPSYDAAFDDLAQLLVLPPQPADLNCDGVVNITDLVAVIDGWGLCPQKGPCPADVNASGAVDVDDLLAVILNWG